jgi:PKD repeat protein
MDDLYAASLRNWRDYGDLAGNHMLVPDTTPTWLSLRISPADNLAPLVQVNPLFDGIVGENMIYHATIWDDDPTTAIEYRWFWGDGSSSPWIAGDINAEASHAYTEAGEYTAYVAAREASSSNGYDDYLMTSNKTKVYIHDFTNTPPHVIEGYDAITFTPENPAAEEDILFEAHFVDDDGDEIEYTWTFGDGSVAEGQNVTHSYDQGGLYEVVLSVTDNQIGMGERPVVVSIIIYVSSNLPPTIDIPDVINVLRKVPTLFEVDAFDPDGDDMRYTWVWGDRAVTVTDVPWANHTYMPPKVFELTVFADDLTGIPGHNVSDTGLVNVKRANAEPVIISFEASNTEAQPGQIITFNALVFDEEGDALELVFDFGDWTSEVLLSGPTAPGEIVSFDVAKAYDDPGAYTAHLYVSDGIAATASDGILITVEAPANLPPIVSPLSDVSADVGEEITFVASAVDPDGDALDYTWDFGDETPLAAGQMVTHAYAAEGDYLFTVYVDDRNGHNVSVSASANIANGSGVGDPWVSYYWDDMFATPFEDWWDLRASIYGNWIPLRDEYPYIYEYSGSPISPVGPIEMVMSNMRLDVHAGNLTTVNMNSSPQFLPLLGTERGGTASIDWYMDYLTYDEGMMYGDIVGAWNDGFLMMLNGSVVLDDQAAKSVLGVTDSGLADFNGWWQVNQNAVENAYEDWYLTEANDRLDIYNMYEYPLTFLYWWMDAFRSGDSIVINCNMVTWGLEALMTKWLREAFMPTEWWIGEDMEFDAVITDDCAMISLDTVVTGAVKAYESNAVDGQSWPCWVWQGMLQDIIPSSGAHPFSDFDPYADKTLLDRHPGSPTYGEMIPYFYTPGSFDLEEHESMWFRWPAGNQMFLEHVDQGIYNEVWGSMDMFYAEPNGSDIGSSFYEYSNPESTTIGYIGPIDFVNWSQTQTAHGFLEAEWDRLGVLPYGMPYVEFNMMDMADAPPVANAGPDMIVQEDLMVELNGTGSFDDVGIAHYYWEALGVTIADEPTPHVLFSDPGVYVVSLIVEDTIGQLSAPDYAVITVLDCTPPVADAGPDQTVESGTVVFFDGTGSVDNVGIVSYEWTLYDDGIIIMYAQNPNHVFSQVGIYSVMLTVYDQAGNDDTDYVTITVVEAQPIEIVPVSEGMSITIYEQTGAVQSYTFDVADLMTVGGTFATIAMESEIYTISSDGTYLTIHCYRVPPSPGSGTSTGNNIVAVRLDGVAGYEDGIWASMIVNYTIGVGGIEDSLENALGPVDQIGPYGDSLCTYLGDYDSEVILAFTV